MPGTRLPETEFRQWLINVLREHRSMSREDIKKRLRDEFVGLPNSIVFFADERPEFARQFERCIRDLIHDGRLVETEGRLAIYESAGAAQPSMTDVQARDAIKQVFYEAYQRHGLHVIVMAGEVAKRLGLGEVQARRCFDYLAAKDLIRPMTLGGGFAPTVALVDEIEGAGTA